MDTNISYPKDLKKLRACTRCSLVKCIDQFKEKGCENCNEEVEIRNNNHFVSEYTTANFKGLMIITNPKHSWVARWLHKTHLIPGFYCIDKISPQDNEDEDGEEDKYEDEIDN